MKNIFKTVWDSEVFETFSEITCGTLELLGEVLADTFGNEKPGYDLNSGVTYVPESNHETYDYWMTLTYDEQKQYFENNQYLKIYTNDFYEKDRHLTAQHMQHIADKLGREFVNKYDRY